MLITLSGTALTEDDGFCRGSLFPGFISILTRFYVWFYDESWAGGLEEGSWTINLVFD